MFDADDCIIVYYTVPCPADFSNPLLRASTRAIIRCHPRYYTVYDSVKRAPPGAYSDGRACQDRNRGNVKTSTAKKTCLTTYTIGT